MLQASVPDLSSLPGFGPKKAAMLYDRLQTLRETGGMP
jgi:DNA uptake protein ComE-like DNA-binding protein